MWSYKHRNLFIIWHRKREGATDEEKPNEGRNQDRTQMSSTPTSTRDEISKENRKQADCITGDRAGAASRFLLCQLQPLADPSIQLLSPKTCVWERLCGRSLGSLSCTALSPWSIIEEKSLGFTQLKQGAASIIASIFFRAAGYHPDKAMVAFQVINCQSF